MAIQTLRCPHCSAPLTRDDQGKDPTECPYCHSALTSNKPIIVVNQPGTARPMTTGNLVATIAVLVLVAGGFLFSFLTGSSKSTEPVSVPAVAVPVEAPPPPPPAKPPEPPSPVKEVLRFGTKGTNPGQIDGANHLAVSDGHFFLGENGTGRVQKFDAEGKYVDSVTMPPDKLTKQNGIFGMAADAKGHVYVNRVGDVLVYDAATLKLARELRGDYPDRYYHGGIAVDEAGNVLVTADRMGDMSMFTLSSAGKVLGHQKTYATDLAIDGTGKLFLVGGDGLEVRDAKGAVLSKVGVKGERIAYDGKGHVFVLTSSNVEVVSAEGTQISSLPVTANDIAFDAQGRLVALSSDHVTVWEVTLP